MTRVKHLKTRFTRFTLIQPANIAIRAEARLTFSETESIDRIRVTKSGYLSESSANWACCPGMRST
jgi:hypothetical protein